MFLFRPSTIPSEKVEAPLAGLYAFALRLSGWRQIVAVGLALIAAAFSIAPIELQRRMIDDAIIARDAEMLLLLAGLYLGATLISSGVKFCQRLYEGWLGESAILKCRQRLARIHDGRDDAAGGGSAVAILRAEIEQVGGFVGQALSEPATHLGILAGVLGYMLVVEPLIAAVGLAILVPQLVLTFYVQKKLNELTGQRIGHLRTMSETVGAAPPGRLDRPAFDQSAGEIFSNRIMFSIWKHLGMLGLNLLNAIAPLSILVVGGMMVIEGRTELGVVVAMTSGIVRIAAPIRELISFYRLAQRISVTHGLIVAWMAGAPLEHEHRLSPAHPEAHQ